MTTELSRWGDGDERKSRFKDLYCRAPSPHHDSALFSAYDTCPYHTDAHESSVKVSLHLINPDEANREVGGLYFKLFNKNRQEFGMQDNVQLSHLCYIIRGAYLL